MENPEPNPDEKEEKDDRVWELLTQTSTTEPGAFFSRNVVREVRKLAVTDADASRGGFFAWFRQPVAALAGGIAAIAVAAMIFAPSEDGLGTTSVVDVGIYSPADELADVEYLGELVAVSDPAMLTDQAFADLF